MKLTRRSLLRSTLLSGGAVAAHFAAPARPFPRALLQGDPFAGGVHLGNLEFLNEGSAPLDTSQGTELDGRLYTDLSAIDPSDPTTPAEKFYIRTRASSLLPDAASWQIKVGGLVERPTKLNVAALKTAATPMGIHLLECAGNVRLTRFGLISVGQWAGVPISAILNGAKIKTAAARVLISGFDHYATESKTSVPGASWVFTPAQLNGAGAFLATELNGQPLTPDHGAPVRLVVPGWYGCSCIKWVNEISLAGDDAKATSQMQEYAGRTMQKGVPDLAKDYQPAIIEQAATPIRVEKWSIAGKIRYRVVGIAWGGFQPVKILQIRFNPEEDYVQVENFHPAGNDPWTLWSHTWRPKAPGTYLIRLAVKEPVVRAPRLDSGYYVRGVEIREV